MRILIALVLLIAASCATPDAGAPVLGEDAMDEAAAARLGVETLLRDWSAAGAEGRWGDLKALYADDPAIYWVEQGRVAYRDYASVIAGVDQVAAMSAMIRSDVRDIVVTPIAADAASFRTLTTIGFVSADFSFDFEGVFTGVAVKRDGRWKFLQGHLSKAESAPK